MCLIEPIFVVHQLIVFTCRCAWWELFFFSCNGHSRPFRIVQRIKFLYLDCLTGLRKSGLSMLKIHQQRDRYLPPIIVCPTTDSLLWLHHIWSKCWNFHSFVSDCFKHWSILSYTFVWKFWKGTCVLVVKETKISPKIWINYCQHQFQPEIVTRIFFSQF